MALALQVPASCSVSAYGALVRLLYCRFGGLARQLAWPWPAVLPASSGRGRFFIGGFWRAKRAWLVTLLSMAAGFAMGATPIVLKQVWQLIIGLAGWAISPRWFLGLSFGITVYVATLIFGTYLMILTLLGLEQHQAFGALAQPGTSSRPPARAQGRMPSCWVLGRVDPLSRRQV